MYFCNATKKRIFLSRILIHVKKNCFSRHFNFAVFRPQPRNFHAIKYVVINVRLWVYICYKRKSISLRNIVRNAGGGGMPNACTHNYRVYVIYAFFTQYIYHFVFIEKKVEHTAVERKLVEEYFHFSHTGKSIGLFFSLSIDIDQLNGVNSC